MSDSTVQFTWVIDLQQSWPPRTRPKPPFGVTTIEVLRSCPLRVIFDASHDQGYERRLGPAARVGLAFHHTLQWLFEHDPAGAAPEERAEDARRQFMTELAAQDAERQLRPRERGLPHDEQRINRALEAILAEARHLSAFDADTHYVASPVAETMHETSPMDEDLLTFGFEIPVRSRDGLMAGRIDRVDQIANGTRLTDFKSALRDDLPERYERQIQLYAWMWHDKTGEWPVEGLLVYPFTGTVHEVPVDELHCDTTATESIALIHELQKEQLPHQRARPGEVCQVCEYRPWCKAFWDWQSAEPSHRVALDKAYYGFEGQIVNLEKRDHYWKLGIQWRNYIIDIKAPAERFPQLKNAQFGDVIRALEMRLQGQLYAPRAIVSEYSELWILRKQT